MSQDPKNPELPNQPTEPIAHTDAPGKNVIRPLGDRYALEDPLGLSMTGLQLHPDGLP